MKIVNFGLISAHMYLYLNLYRAQLTPNEWKTLLIEVLDSNNTLFAFFIRIFIKSFLNFCIFCCFWFSYVLPFQLITLKITPIGNERKRKINFFNDFLEWLIVLTTFSRKTYRVFALAQLWFFSFRTVYSCQLKTLIASIVV